MLGALALLAFPLFMNFSIPLNPYAYHDDNNLDLGKSIIKKKKGQHFWEHQYQFMYNQRKALINESSIIDMQFSGSYPPSDSKLIDQIGRDAAVCPVIFCAEVSCSAGPRGLPVSVYSWIFQDFFSFFS